MESGQTGVGTVLSRGRGVRDHRPDRDRNMKQISSSTKSICFAGAIYLERTLHDAAGYFHQGTCIDVDTRQKRPEMSTSGNMYRYRHMHEKF